MQLAAYSHGMKNKISSKNQSGEIDSVAVS
jgi:hypothetical protein